MDPLFPSEKERELSRGRPSYFFEKRGNQIGKPGALSFPSFFVSLAVLVGSILLPRSFEKGGERSHARPKKAGVDHSYFFEKKGNQIHGGAYETHSFHAISSYNRLPTQTFYKRLPTKDFLQKRMNYKVCGFS